MNQKKTNRKYFKTIKKIKEEYNYESKIITSENLISLNINIRFFLNDNFDIIESKLYITNNLYNKIIKQDSTDTLLLDKETIYLEEEGILDWVKDSKTGQIVPSPFHSYGKSSIFINPIFFDDDFIGYYISLSRSSRLEFDDSKLSTYNDIITKYCLKLELFTKNELIKKYKLQNLLLTNKLNEFPEFINSKTIVHTTSDNIKESVFILKSNLNLLESDSEMYFTRLKKISSEVENIHNLSVSLTDKISQTKYHSNITSIINEILRLLHNKVNDAGYDINISNLDSLEVTGNHSVLFNSFLYILDYLITTSTPFNSLNIIGKTKPHKNQIIFFLGYEHYTINNISRPEDLEISDIPDELIIANNLLASIGASLSIKNSVEIGYLVKIGLK